LLLSEDIQVNLDHTYSAVHKAAKISDFIAHFVTDTYQTKYDKKSTTLHYGSVTGYSTFWQSMPICRKDV